MKTTGEGGDMEQHFFEYRILVEYINPEQPGVVPQLSHTQDQENLTGMLNEVAAHIPESIADGWEVVSHDLAVFHNTFILSLLIRRPTGI